MKRLAAGLAIGFGFWCAPHAEAASCEDLAKLALPSSAITSAQVVAAGAFEPPTAPRPENAAPNAEAPEAVSYKSVPAFCRVMATLKPSSDSDIRIEVWLPMAGWNGSFQGVGNGGWAGTIGTPRLAAR